MNRYFIFILLSISLTSYSQKWERTFGSPYRDDAGVDVFENYDKGYLVMGGYEGEYSWLIKTDINGNLLWHKYFADEEPYLDIFSTVLSDIDGNIYLLGWRVIQFDSGWPLVVKLNSCGELKWCRQFIDDDYWWGWFQDAILLDDGSILGMVHMESQEQIEMVFLYGISPDGELSWRNSYASKNNYPLIHSRSPLTLKSLNNMFVISGYCYYAYPNNPPHGYLRPMFIGIDSLFQEQFVLPFGMADSISGKGSASIQINDTLIMGVGSHWFITDKDIYGNSLLMFYTNSGEEINYNDIPNNAIDTNIKGNMMRDIEQINDSLYYASTYYGENYQGNNNGEFVIDTAGVVFNHSYVPNTVAKTRLIKTTDNKYLKVASIKDGDWDILLYKNNDTLGSDTMNMYPFKYDTLCPYSILSDTIDLSGCLITTGINNYSITENPTNINNKLNLYPNPAYENVTVEYDLLSKGSIGYVEFISLEGRILKKVYVSAEENCLIIDLDDFTPGLYLCRLICEGKVLETKKLMIIE